MKPLPELKRDRHKLGTVCLPLLIACTHAGVPSVSFAANTLVHRSLEDLLEVSVVGASKYEQKQRDIAAAVSVITREEINTFGWRTLDDALASLPGLYTTYDRQYTALGTRGFGVPGDFNTRVLVTINGNRINDPLYDGGPTGREFPLDMALVERIEVIPGPGGAVYGQNAMFGVVNVVTRSGASVHGAELAASYQSGAARTEGRASWGSVLENGLDVLVSVSKMRARGDDVRIGFGDAGVSGKAVGLDGERSEQVFARVAGRQWSAEFVHGDRRKDDPTAGYFSDPLTSGQFQADRYDLLQLKWNHQTDDGRLQFNGRVFLGEESYRSKLAYDGAFFKYPGKASWHGAEIQLISTALTDHTLMWGVEYQNNARIDQYILDLSDPSNNQRIASPSERIGVYVQDEWHISPTLAATFGLRVDRDEIIGTHTSPRVGLIWSASDETTLKFLYGQAHRAPNAYESQYDDGISLVSNAHLKGESIKTYEIVADHRLSQNTQLRGTLYRWSMQDIITLGIDPISTLPQYQSGGSVKAQGLELSANHIWSNKVRLRGSVAFQEALSEDDQSLTNSPKMLGRLNLSAPLPLPGGLLGYELRYDSRRRTVSGSTTGGYPISNLRLSARVPSDKVEIALEIRNLLNRRYDHPAADTNWQRAIEQDGRSVALALTFAF